MKQRPGHPGLRPRAASRRALALALALLGCAVGPLGCGGGGGGGGPSITVRVKMTTAPRAQASACGKRESYRQYAGHREIGVAGRVRPRPAGHWRAKVKLKRCEGTAFRDLRTIKATTSSHGRFGATIPTLPPGYYELRGEVRTGGEKVKSKKLYFHIAQAG